MPVDPRSIAAAERVLDKEHIQRRARRTFRAKMATTTRIQSTERDTVLPVIVSNVTQHH